MHQALSIPEVVKKICECFGTDDDPQDTDRKTLMKIALTCQAFLEHALDELWRVQKTLNPLLLCFPEELIQKRRVYGLCTSILKVSFRKECVIKPKDWKRIIYYAPRIQYIRNTRGSWFVSDPDVWPVLATLRPTSLPYLLPNLKGIDFESEDTDFHNIRLFLSPQLRHLQLNFLFSKIPALRLSLFAALPHFSPRLQSLYLKYPPNNFDFDSLVCWDSIQELRLKDIQPGALTHIARMLSLKTLWIHGFNLEGSQTPVTLVFEPGAFPSLISFKLEGARFNATIAHQILQAVTSKKINSIFISTEWKAEQKTESKQQWGDLINTTMSHQDTLTELHLQDTADEYSPMWPLDGELLRPLSFLRQLSRLTIISPAPFQITNQIYEELSLQWLQLQELVITVSDAGYRHDLRRSQANLQALISIIINCRNLKSLDIHVDASKDVPQVENNVDVWNAIANTRIESIGLGTSRCLDPVKISLFLSALLPNLHSIRIPKGYQGDGKPGWAEVERLMQAIHVARQWNT